MISKILTAYGFKTREQQLAFIELLALAACFEPKTLTEDLNATGHSNLQIETALCIATEASKSPFNAELILDKLFMNNSLQGWPAENHQWLIKVTQREFFGRKSGQERWQIETGKWLTQHAGKINQILPFLPHTKTIPLQKQVYHAMVIFGARATIIKKRLQYAKDLIEASGITIQHLYLLAGERIATLDEKVDGSQTYLQQVAEKYASINKQYGIAENKVIETQLMQAAYDEVKGSGKFATIPMSLIHTPKGDKDRPVTEMTLTALAAFLLSTDLSSKPSGDYVFISSIPHINTQYEDTLFIMGEKIPTIQCEVVGDKLSDLPITETVSAIAGALLKGAPRVAIELGSQKNKLQLRELFEAQKFGVPVVSLGVENKK